MKRTNSPLRASTQLIRINRMGMCSASVFFSQKSQVYGGYILGNGIAFFIICSIPTCVVHVHFLGWRGFPRMV